MRVGNAVYNQVAFHYAPLHIFVGLTIQGDFTGDAFKAPLFHLVGVVEGNRDGDEFVFFIPVFIEPGFQPGVGLYFGIVKPGTVSYYIKQEYQQQKDGKVFSQSNFSRVNIVIIPITKISRFLLFANFKNHENKPSRR